MSAGRILIAALLLVMLGGCVSNTDYDADSTDLMDISGFSMYYPSGELHPEETLPEETSLYLLTCGREFSELVDAIVNICKENDIDYKELSPLLPVGEALYSLDYAPIYALKFSSGKLLVAPSAHVEDGVKYYIEYF